MKNNKNSRPISLLDVVYSFEAYYAKHPKLAIVVPGLMRWGREGLTASSKGIPATQHHLHIHVPTTQLHNLIRRSRLVVYEIGAMPSKLVGSFLSIDNSLPTLPFQIFISRFKLPLISRKPLILSITSPNRFSVELPSQDIRSDYSFLSGFSCPKFEGVFPFERYPLIPYNGRLRQHQYKAEVALEN